jgi:hypothetical protein
MADPNNVFDFGPIAGPEASRGFLLIGTGYGIMRGISCAVVGLGGADNAIIAEKLGSHIGKVSRIRTWTCEKYGPDAIYVFARLREDFSRILDVTDTYNPADRLQRLVAALLYGNPTAFIRDVIGTADTYTGCDVHIRYSLRLAEKLIALINERNLETIGLPIDAFVNIWIGAQRSASSSTSVAHPAYLSPYIGTAPKSTDSLKDRMEANTAAPSRADQGLSQDLQERDQEIVRLQELLRLKDIERIELERIHVKEIEAAKLAAVRKIATEANDYRSKVILLEGSLHLLKTMVQTANHRAAELQNKLQIAESQKNREPTDEVKRLKETILGLHRRLDGFGADSSVAGGVSNNVQILIREKSSDGTEMPLQDLGITTKAKLNIIIKYMNGWGNEDDGYLDCPTCAAIMCCVCLKKLRICPCCRAVLPT